MQLLRLAGPHDAPSGRAAANLVVLHATGLPVMAYQPLAAALARAGALVVWGLDLPGHGSAAAAAVPLTASCVSLAHVVQLVVDAVRGAGLQGCAAFGHSAGGAVALLAASACPGLFSAVYCFEPVVASPASHAMLAAAMAAGAVSTSGQQLASMARRRRGAFGSRQAARQHLAAKPPFARMHPACLALYVQHGLVDAVHQQQQQQAAAGAAAAPPGVAAQQARVTQQQSAGVVLACPPSVEAAYYAALDPPPAIVPQAVTCPVALAVAVLPGQQGDDGRSAAARFASHAAVKAWALQHQQPGQGSALHSILAVLGMELAALMPTARLQVVGGVTHFGPLEQPEALAASCVQFLGTSLARVQQQARL